MANTGSRTLRLLSLLQTRRYWPGEELARQLRVSPRTLRRDIDRLRELGYPIQAQRGVAGGYQLAAGTALPPLVGTDRVPFTRLRSPGWHVRRAHERRQHG